MGLAPEKASRIIVVLEDSNWTTTDPWTLAGDNLLSLSLELLKQSTLASIQCPGILIPDPLATRIGVTVNGSGISLE